MPVLLSSGEKKRLSPVTTQMWTVARSPSRLNRGARAVCSARASGLNSPETADSLAASGLSKENLWQGHPVKPDALAGYRDTVTAYTVTQDATAATGTVAANPQLGSGGLQQLFIPNFQEVLQAGQNVPLK